MTNRKIRDIEISAEDPDNLERFSRGRRNIPEAGSHTSRTPAAINWA